MLPCLCTVHHLCVLEVVMLCGITQDDGIAAVSPHNWKMDWWSVVSQASEQPWHGNLAAVAFLCLGLQNAPSYA